MKYKIYVDLDGVLVDFDREMERIGFPLHIVSADKKVKSQFWQKVGQMAKQGQPFWGRMKPMNDAAELWSYVKRYEPEILSATGHVGNAVPEKRDWVRDHLGSHVVCNLVSKSADKAKFAAATHILIDDRQKSIAPWTEAGGIGILHTSAVDTIRALKDLGL